MNFNGHYFKPKNTKIYEKNQSKYLYNVHFQVFQNKLASLSLNPAAELIKGTKLALKDELTCLPNQAYHQCNGLTKR